MAVYRKITIFAMSIFVIEVFGKSLIQEETYEYSSYFCWWCW